MDVIVTLNKAYVTGGLLCTCILKDCEQSALNNVHILFVSETVTKRMIYVHLSDEVQCDLVRFELFVLPPAPLADLCGTTWGRICRLGLPEPSGLSTVYIQNAFPFPYAFAILRPSASDT
jgi:hypothetical protein